MKALLPAIAIAALASVAPVRAADETPHYREVLGAPAGPALLGPALDRASKDVSSVLRCPVCQGLSVEDSPSGMAQAMRAQVREMTAQGYGEEQILTYFERSYGEFVRLEPRREGINWFVWLAPIGALAIGAAVIFAVLRRGDAGAGDTEAAATKSDDPELEMYLEQVRDATRNRDQQRAP